MRLNDTIPGLPVWPDIMRTENGNIGVAGEHLSYAGRRKTRSAVLWGGLLGMPMAAFVGSIFPPVALLFLLAMGFFLMFGVSRFIEGFFKEGTVILFTPHQIFIKGIEYPIHPGLTVQFKADESPVPIGEKQRLEKLQQTLKKTTFDDLTFRSVEMVWGAREVFITSISDEKRARQFAIALQIAHSLSQEEANPQAHYNKLPRNAPTRLPE